VLILQYISIIILQSHGMIIHPLNVNHFIQAMITSEYVWREVYNIDPNFPWASEFTLQYLRHTDEFYIKYSKVMRILAGRRVTVTVNPSGIVITGPDLCNIRDTLLSIQINNISQASQDSIMIYDTNFTCNDIINCMFLLNPRAYPYMYNYGIIPERRSVPEQNDYPYLVHHSTPEALKVTYPSLFPELPTDIDIIRQILSLGEYNLNAILKWLELRSTLELYLRSGFEVTVQGYEINNECIHMYNQCIQQGQTNIIYDIKCKLWGIVRTALTYYNTDLMKLH